jgi:hypothetical protein
MTSVEENERSERRDIKAGRRNASQSIMQSDNETEDDIRPTLGQRPGWMQQMVAKSGYTGRPNKLEQDFVGVPQHMQTRTVALGRNTTRQAPAQAPAANVPAQAPAPQHQQRTVTAGRVGAQSQQQQPSQRPRVPVQGDTNRGDISNPEFYAWAQEARLHADINKGALYHYAGQHMPAPGPIRWEGY